MKIKQGALALAFVLLAGIYYLDAQSKGHGQSDAPVQPDPVNLDVPPQETPDPSPVLAKEQAALAIRDPQAFHQSVLSQNPGQVKKEQDAAAAILNPAAYQRAHPAAPGLVRTQAVAAHAILNPHFPLSGGN